MAPASGTSWRNDSSYGDRPLTTEATLAALTEQESDGRPAWLRRWTTEVRREIAVERYSARREPTSAPAEERLSDHGRGSFDTVRGPQSAGTYANGYTGHSIEAALDFETSSHLATDFEADATEDLLSLSGDQPLFDLPTVDLTTADLTTANLTTADLPASDLAASDHGPTGVTADATTDAGTEGGSNGAWISAPEGQGIHAPATALRPPESRVEQSADHESGAHNVVQSSAHFPASLPRLDAQAVRAAIFRLAHEAPTSRGASTVPETAPPQTGFAEVAFQLWRDSDADLRVNDGDDVLTGEGSLEQRGHDAFGTASAPLDASFYGEASARYGETSARQNAQEAIGLAQTDDAVETAGAFEPPNEGEERVSRSAEPDFIPAEAEAGKTDEMQHTLAGLNVLQSVADPGQLGALISHDENPESSQIVQTAAGSNTGGVDVDIDVPSISGVYAGSGTLDNKAGDAPALAHDAGNLLSALTLYSELLALSGVLQERHKHYAQDLKLLAARSEVLINRLLASCHAAESRARSVMTENGRGLVVPIATGAFASLAAEREEDASGRPVPPDVAIEDRDAGPPDIARESLDASADRRRTESRRAPEVVFARSVEASAENAPDLLPVEEARTRTEEVPLLNLVELLTGWKSLLSMIGHGSVEVNFGPNASLPIRVKEDAMERILVNLVHNAMTATRSGGSIRIGVGRVEGPRATRKIPSSDGRAQPGNTMVLTVDDSGCGMSNEQIAQIFTGPSANGFGDASADNRNRRGLGLQIVRELIASSGGQLAVYSRQGAGTRIEMTWPAVETAALPVRIPPSSVRLAGETRSDRRQDDYRSRLEQANELYPGDTSRWTTDSTANDLKGAIAC